MLIGKTVALSGLVLALVAAVLAPFNLLNRHRLPVAYWPYVWPYWLGQLPLPELVPVPPLGTEAGTAGRFELGAYEVTFAEYDFFVLDTQRREEGAEGLAFPADESWGRGDRPVINVRWTDAYAYSQWLSKKLADQGKACRLPTEAEWEYAARAGADKEYGIPAPAGSDDITGKGLANCDGCGGEWDKKERTAPVRSLSFRPNAWGLHHMHGNVWEWCQNDYDDPDRVDPGGSESRVLRGGSWGGDRVLARADSREHYPPYGRNHHLGFRVLCASPISR